MWFIATRLLELLCGKSDDQKPDNAIAPPPSASNKQDHALDDSSIVCAAAAAADDDKQTLTIEILQAPAQGGAATATATLDAIFRPSVFSQPPSSAEDVEISDVAAADDRNTITVRRLPAPVQSGAAIAVLETIMCPKVSSQPQSTTPPFSSVGFDMSDVADEPFTDIEMSAAAGAESTYEEAADSGNNQLCGESLANQRTVIATICVQTIMEVVQARMMSAHRLSKVRVSALIVVQNSMQFALTSEVQRRHKSAQLLHTFRTPPPSVQQQVKVSVLRYLV
jgi:hypothetical protein